MFDDALLESRKTHALGGKRLSLPLAIGLHLAVIGAFVGASTWFTGEAPEPSIPVVFPTVSSAPPPPPGGGGESHHPPDVKSHPTQPLIQPSHVPDVPVLAIDDAMDMEQPEISDAESGPGSRDGIDGGTGTPSRRTRRCRSHAGDSAGRRRRPRAGAPGAPRARLPGGRA